MTQDYGASPDGDRGSREPSPASGLGPDGLRSPSEVEQIILDRLSNEQRAFILRMKPHRESQRINAWEFDAIWPCVDLDEDAWPDTYWFGRMTMTWSDGHASRNFMFNEVGLNVRGFLATNDAERTAP